MLRVAPSLRLPGPYADIDFYYFNAHPVCCGLDLLEIILKEHPCHTLGDTMLFLHPILSIENDAQLGRSQ